MEEDVKVKTERQRLKLLKEKFLTRARSKNIARQISRKSKKVHTPLFYLGESAEGMTDVPIQKAMDYEHLAENETEMQAAEREPVILPESSIKPLEPGSTVHDRSNAEKVQKLKPEIWTALEQTDMSGPVPKLNAEFSAVCAKLVESHCESVMNKDEMEHAVEENDDFVRAETNDIVGDSARGEDEYYADKEDNDFDGRKSMYSDKKDTDDMVDKDPVSKIDNKAETFVETVDAEHGTAETEKDMSQTFEKEVYNEPNEMRLTHGAAIAPLIMDKNGSPIALSGQVNRANISILGNASNQGPRSSTPIPGVHASSYTGETDQQFQEFEEDITGHRETQQSLAFPDATPSNMATTVQSPEANLGNVGRQSVLKRQKSVSEVEEKEGNTIGNINPGNSSFDDTSGVWSRRFGNHFNNLEKCPFFNFIHGAGDQRPEGRRRGNSECLAGEQFVAASIAMHHVATYPTLRSHSKYFC